ncbi:auxin efflux carrier component 4-like [Eucalyptus grandis]|uniref:auxin efflux carrier component 4-like n=1 Tax=Eucalyptus grandis TaxID=71139 RepID=UPI00192ECE71|nr:auxin efflux carrier component 4-like [Eucalyptus grandis]
MSFSHSCELRVFHFQISSITNVVSLDGRNFLKTNDEIGNDNKLHVIIRKPNSSRRSLGPGSFAGLTPRPSNLTGAEIYSLGSSQNRTPRSSNFNQSDFSSMMGLAPRRSNFGSDPYSVQSSCGPTQSHQISRRTRRQWHGLSRLQDSGLPGADGSDRIPSSESRNRIRFHQKQQERATAAAAKAGMKSQPRRQGAPHVCVELQHVAGFPRGRAPRVQGDRTRTVGAIWTLQWERRGKRLGEREQGASSTAELHPKAAGVAEQLGGSGGRKGREQMPPASIMTCLILIMVWRKLIRNPNTYSSLIGLPWSLVTFQ